MGFERKKSNRAAGRLPLSARGRNALARRPCGSIGSKKQRDPGAVLRLAKAPHNEIYLNIDSTYLNQTVNYFLRQELKRSCLQT